ncbi:hypothetical protein [Methylobacterium nigriterrae]|uniref:hypothetical protein n=1 Tax=Methylobacterium nigriterrae TaxID=3127512 RepID=UPI003013E85D
MAETPTVGELVKQTLVRLSDVNAAVDAFLADPRTAPFPISEEYEVDLAAAVKASRQATALLRDTTAMPGARRMTVRAAILLARPKKR